MASKEESISQEPNRSPQVPDLAPWPYAYVISLQDMNLTPQQKAESSLSFDFLIITMRFSTLSPVAFFLGLGLAYNETSPGMRFWNTTTSLPTATSPNFIAVTSSSSIEEVATIQIQIGSLSGSGVINLSNVATTPEVAQLNGLLNSTSFSNQAYPTKTNSLQPTFCPLTTAAFPSGSTSAENFNATVGASTGQPSARLTSLASQIFTGSGSRTSAELLKLPVISSAFIVQIAIMSLV
jgi:hypothetical protein